MKRLIVHIGAPKAGSTSIQDYLHRNGPALAQTGLLYPETGRARVVSRRAHHNLAYERHPGQAAKYEPDGGGWTQAVAELEASDAHTAIVSSEALFSLPAAAIAGIRDATAGLDVTVVAYLRRQDQYFESFYGQRARFGRVDEPVDAFVEARRGMGDYGPALSRWAARFEQMVVLPFERVVIADGPTRALLARIGLSIDALPEDSVVKNPRTGLKVIAAVALVRDRLGEPEVPYRTVRRIRDHFRDDPDEVTDYHLLDYDEAVTVFDGYREQNRALAERYGTAGAPDFFTTRPTREEYTGRAPDVALSPEDQAWVERLARHVVKARRSGR